MNRSELKTLLAKYLGGILSEEEHTLLRSNLNHPDMDAVLDELLPQVKMDSQASLSYADKEILERIFQSEPQSAPIVQLQRRKVFRWWRVAAAVLLIFIAGAAYLLLREKNSTQHYADLPQSERFKNDVDPAREGVLLTTGNGQMIRLDSAGATQLITDGVIPLENKDGSVTYRPANSAIFYHTISTHKGMDYQLTLTDGSKVWLDAMSSIHFPTSFPGNERVVEVTGQAYFEVAKDASKPFKVRSGEQTIEVLGTHFNVNAHDGNIKTTLLEGSVKIASSILKPGQQAINNNGQISLHNDADIEEVMAWKNGQFYFDGASIEVIMQQLERWYDIDVQYEGKVKEVFVVDIPRKLPVSKILVLLEKTKQVEFVIEGNRIMVLSRKQ